MILLGYKGYVIKNPSDKSDGLKMYEIMLSMLDSMINKCPWKNIIEI